MHYSENNDKKEFSNLIELSRIIRTGIGTVYLSNSIFRICLKSPAFSSYRYIPLATGWPVLSRPFHCTS